MSARKSRAKRAQTANDDEPRGYADTDVDEGDGIEVVLRDGVLGFEPQSVRRLDAGARVMYLDIAEVTTKMLELQDIRRQIIQHARREHGLSWNVIGFACRTSGEAARQRFGGTFGEG
jgi:hypothetical protein